MVKIKECKHGDIIEIQNTTVVLVDNGCDRGFIFTALPTTYVFTEINNNISYGVSNSGYYNVHEDDLVKRIGHIELYQPKD